MEAARTPEPQDPAWPQPQKGMEGAKTKEERARGPPAPEGLVSAASGVAGRATSGGSVGCDTAWTKAQVPRPKTKTVRVLVNRRAGVALVDPGCTQRLVKKGWARPDPRGREVLIRCVHGDVKAYPTGKALVSVNGRKALMQVGIDPSLPYDVILGRNWPAFTELACEGLNSEAHEGRAGEAAEDELGEEQRRDPSIRAAWERAEAGQGTSDSGARLALQQGALYRWTKDPKTGEEVRQLVLPALRQAEALRLAHDCPLGGHRGRQPP